MGVRHSLRVYKAYLLLHLKTAMEYRMNFFIQSLFMVLNDSLWLFIWYFLFAYFQTINGYGMADAMLVFGISALAYGLVAVFFGNRRRVWELVADGRLDFYLSLPVDELFHALISKSAESGVGDIIFGIVLIAVVAPERLLLGIVVSMLGAIVLLAFGNLIDSLGFFMQNPKAATKSLSNFVIGFATWPIDVYGGATRAVLYFIPIAFISTVPHNILVDFGWVQLGGLTLVAFTLLLLSVLVFKWGLRRYESGNMISTRT
jgi:ABC-2 type transport system permease protein